MTLQGFKERYLSKDISEIYYNGLVDDYNLTKSSIIKKHEDEFEQNKRLFESGTIGIQLYGIIVESIEQMKQEELRQLDAAVREVYLSNKIQRRLHHD